MTQQLSALNVLPERMLAVAKHGAANVYRVRSTVTAAPQHRAPRVYRASTGRAQWVDHPALVSSAQRVKPTQMKTALLHALHVSEGSFAALVRRWLLLVKKLDRLTLTMIRLRRA